MRGADTGELHGVFDGFGQDGRIAQPFDDRARRFQTGDDGGDGMIGINRDMFARQTIKRGGKISARDDAHGVAEMRAHFRRHLGFIDA